ncbi:hypothetical protein KKB55_15545 [Myxococcota bacterium]|nr:hypothetical protein [Myxococcota bacterium]MBU1899153.1 hypothetical protein [Myxococcota bacterium]
MIEGQNRRARLGRGWLALLIGFGCGLALAKGAQMPEKQEEQIKALVHEARAFRGEVSALKGLVRGRSTPPKKTTPQ